MLANPGPVDAEGEHLAVKFGWIHTIISDFLLDSTHAILSLILTCGHYVNVEKAEIQTKSVKPKSGVCLQEPHHHKAVLPNCTCKVIIYCITDCQTPQQ